MRGPKPPPSAVPRSSRPGPGGADVDDVRIARLLDAADREYAEGLDEAAAFRRLSARLEQGAPRSGWQRRWPILAVALGLVVALVVAPSVRDGQRPRPRVAADAPVPSEPALASPPAGDPSLDGATAAPVIRISERATPLAAGQRSHFPDGTVAAVRVGSVAQVANVKRKTRVVIERGQIELSVAPQAPGSGFEVESGAYRFEVLGTVFRVEVSSSRVSLEVTEGKVAVWQGQRLVKHVAAGQLWKSEPERAQPAVAAAVESPAEPAADCLGLARRGQPQQAEQCFERRASGSGLDAELALYEVARLRVDVLGNSDGALAALSEHAERFPNGSLRHEVDLFRVELLARLGRAREALSATEALLGSASGRERAAEIHVLRGNVYRQSLGDPASAEREYARAEQLGGAAGAQATYLRGLCFEALGDPAAAVDSYRRYTSVSGRPHAQAARARLQQLERRSSPSPEKVKTP
jgi:hypothetical protein